MLQVYEYGITSLADKRDFLQKGDVVQFQVAQVKATGLRRATRLTAKRKFQKSRVDSIKSNVSPCSILFLICRYTGRSSIQYKNDLISHAH